MQGLGNRFTKGSTEAIPVEGYEPGFTLRPAEDGVKEESSICLHDRTGTGVGHHPSHTAQARASQPAMNATPPNGVT